ncbi:hypothetical protein AQ611_03470 [Burkholderia singularis]|nr:hypothetical protein AQ611_03470 [Burkholderia sp. Bp7605]
MVPFVIDSDLILLATLGAICGIAAVRAALSTLGNQDVLEYGQCLVDPLTRVEPKIHCKIDAMQLDVSFAPCGDFIGCCVDVQFADKAPDGRCASQFDAAARPDILSILICKWRAFNEQLVVMWRP